MCEDCIKQAKDNRDINNRMVNDMNIPDNTGNIGLIGNISLESPCEHEIINRNSTKEEIENILLDIQSGNANVSHVADMIFKLINDIYSEREVDFAYLSGVFNTSGIDGLQNEINRLKDLRKEPHDIIKSCRSMDK